MESVIKDAHMLGFNANKQAHYGSILWNKDNLYNFIVNEI